MPEVLDKAKEATSYVQVLLDLRLGPWRESKKRKPPVQSMTECHAKRQRTNLGVQEELSSATVIQSHRRAMAQSEQTQTAAPSTNFPREYSGRISPFPHIPCNEALIGPTDDRHVPTDHSGRYLVPSHLEADGGCQSYSQFERKHREHQT